MDMPQHRTEKLSGVFCIRWRPHSGGRNIKGRDDVVYAKLHRLIEKCLVRVFVDDKHCRFAHSLS